MNFEGVDVTKITGGGEVKYYFHRIDKFIETVLEVSHRVTKITKSVETCFIKTRLKNGCRVYV